MRGLRVAVVLLGPGLALGALAATGLVPGGLLPSGADGYRRLACAWVAGFLLLALPWRREAGRVPVLGPLVALVLAAPFLVFAAIESAEGAAAVRGSLGLVGLAAVGALVLGALPARPRAALAAALVVLLGADLVLGGAGRPLLPEGWTAWAGGRAAPAAWSAAPGATPGPAGVRRGAPAPVDGPPALAEGPGPWYEPAAVATLPEVRPLVLVLDGTRGPPWVEEGAGLFVREPERLVDPPLALDAFDAVLVLSGAWTADAADRARRAEAVAGFVRRGGLLLGPAPDRTWPPGLGERLGAAGAGEESGVGGARGLGLGRVLRVASEAAARAALASGVWVRAWRTAFDGARLPPPATVVGVWREEPRGRRAQGGLLLLQAVLGTLLLWLVGGRALRVGLLAVVAGAVALGVVWSSPGTRPVRVQGVRLDLGGGGGRRVEAVALAAGPGGWRGHVRWRGGGLVRLAGAPLDGDGRLVLGPGRAAWVVRETSVRGLGGGPEARDAAWLLTLVEGPLEPARARLGRVPALDVAVEGEGPVPAATLVVR